MRAGWSSSQELSAALSSWYGSDDDRDNPPGYRKRNYYDSDGNRVHEEHPRSTVTWKQKGIRHDTKHERTRLSKGKTHKDGHDFILCEYQTPPAVELKSTQQVRAVWCRSKQRWELHVVCEEEIATESPGEKTAGVDLGICNPAAVAFSDDALLYPVNTLREDKHYFQWQEYQTEGSHGPSQTAQWGQESCHSGKTIFCAPCQKTLLSGVLTTTLALLLWVTPVMSMKPTGAGTATNALTTGRTIG